MAKKKIAKSILLTPLREIKGNPHIITLWGSNISSAVIKPLKDSIEKIRQPRKLYCNQQNKFYLRKFNTTLTRYLKYLCAVKNKPNFFVTLAFPFNHIGRSEIKDAKNTLKKFFKKIRERYKKSWFMYITEWDRVAGIHFHIQAHLKEVKYRHFKKDMEQIWSKCVKRKRANNLTNIVPFLPERHEKYAWSKDKKSDIVSFLNRVQGNNLIGIINKKNMEFDDKYMALLNDDEFEALNKLLFKDMIRNGLKPFNTLKQLTKQCYSCSSINSEAILNALKDICRG